MFLLYTHGVGNVNEFVDYAVTSRVSTFGDVHVRIHVGDVFASMTGALYHGDIFTYLQYNKYRMRFFFLAVLMLFLQSFVNKTGLRASSPSSSTSI